MLRQNLKSRYDNRLIGSIIQIQELLANKNDSVDSGKSDDLRTAIAVIVADYHTLQQDNIAKQYYHNICKDYDSRADSATIAGNTPF